MASPVRIGSALAGAALAVAAVSISGSGTASADTVVANPADYLVGDTVYFSYGNLANCAMRPNGDVGCDITNGTMNWYGLQVSNISIDVAILPAHPALGPLGQHGRPGSPQLSGGGPTPGSNSPYGSDATLTYGGATCSGSGFRSEVTCTSKGHQFSFGFTSGYN
ncbi:hypothetical protein VMT65_37850 [Nocardia sp. CDC153]|uniref:hypothetical protein n=1 Tax=Nocardia sp. CDC153 TaxID=3112167 RepID=UPI002DBBAEA7|nr:hypothetical protein [Nocardia sp. CDC153]MEC3958851.1 hypothetical protein [Nocardia sp. CDC153]